MGDCCAGSCERPSQVRGALRLEYLTVGWNIVEAGVALWAARASGSVALLGFGIDSCVETLSGAILIWRLRAEGSAENAEAVEALDGRAHKLVGASLLLLAVYVACDGALSLWKGERPESSPVGMALTALSMGVMMWLARAKRRAAAVLESKALAADAFQTTACWWLSVVALAGLGLNAALGWWWADPAAALAMSLLIASEGRSAWRGEDCGCA